jgi:hypothetical protein
LLGIGLPAVNRQGLFYLKTNSMSDKLGFTFYPKDWWTSDTYFDFTPSERYIYLECMFIMYSNDGYMKTQKTQFENRTRIFPTDEEWQNVTSKFILDDKGYTMLSVNKSYSKQGKWQTWRPPKGR